LFAQWDGQSVFSPIAWRNLMRLKMIVRSIGLAGLLTTATVSLYAQQIDQKFYSEMRWRCIGPLRGGRTVAITGVPHEPNLFYMAPVDGGVWKSDDFGNTWKPIFDQEPTGSVGAIAVAPSDPNIIYVGSGEGLQRPDLSVGDGMYKSMDAGKSWSHLDLSDAQQFTAIVVDPKNPDRVFVSVEGHPYGPNPVRGVFRSVDGGKTFEKVLYKDENTGAADVVMDPNDPQVLFAALWAARVAPWEVRSGEYFIIPGSGLYKSTDGGSTWREVTQGLPTAEDGLSRIGIAIAPSNPKRMYLNVETNKAKAGVYRSDDAGESWQLVNSDHRIGGRGPGAMGIAVASDNPDVLYVANTASWKSTDGGRTFVGWKGAPGGDDYQRIWISTENPQIMAISADQGAAISVNGGVSWSTWYNQPTAQFYDVTTDNRFPYWVYGGQQESGSVAIKSRSDYGEITFRDWSLPGVYEYGRVAVDPKDSNIVFGAKLTRTQQDLGEVADVAPEPIKRGEYRYNRTLPLVFSPLDPKTLYFGTNVLFKTTDQGRSWSIISPDLTRESYAMPSNLGAFSAGDPEKGNHRGTIYAVAPSNKEADTIWAGTDDGLIQLTRDGGKTWKNVTPPQLVPWAKVSILEASHFDAGTVYAAINTFRLDDLRPHIFRTRDYGATWQEIVAGLPADAPTDVVREDPQRKGLLFAGTENAVYVSFNDGDSWESLQLNLPHTSMRDLTVHGDDLIVGTHGRSFWILDDITPLRQLTDQLAAQPVILYAPEAALRWRWNRNTDTPLPPDFPAGKNPPDGAILDYYLAASAQGPVTLEVLDSSGAVVRRYASTDKPLPMKELAGEYPIPMYWVRPAQILSGEAGMHRFVWDLHYAPPQALEQEFPISAIVHDTPLYPLGARALPGSYSVKLTVDGKSYTQPLTLEMDPRIHTPLEQLRKQYDMETRTVEGMNNSYESLEQVKSVREQIKGLSKEVRGKEKFTKNLEALDSQCEELEGAKQHSFYSVPSSGKPAENFSTLNQHFAQILAIADSADSAPTTQVTAAFQDLQRSESDLRQRWSAIRERNIADLNNALKKAGLSTIDPNKPLGEELGGAAEGDDEP
jgi:photosystem II stability/assembly factor-like uncharacterized protein